MPDGPLAFNQRSLFAFKAVRLYKRARKAGSDVAVLCPAVAVLQAFSAQLATLPEGERPRDRADVADALQTIEEQVGEACMETPPDDLLEIGSADDRPRTDPLPRSGPPARQVPVVRPPPQAEAHVKRRPLRIAGWTTLGAGLGLGTAAIAMLARAAGMQAQVDGLNAVYPAASGIKIPSGDAQRFDDATSRGERADRLAIGLGLPAIGLVVSGVALLVLDAHRERAGRRVALHPSPAGIGLGMEF